MTLSIFLGICIVYLIISLLILPFQYRALVALKKEEKKYKIIGKKQGDMYDEMDASQLILHQNMQGNPIFFLANIMSSLIYWMKHRKEKP